jgi:NitT/TauT family transport system substrate-binding protein
MKNKKVGNWLGGNQYELFAALVRAGMDPNRNKGVTIVKQPFDMGLFLNRQIDAASAMTYNELAQVLENKNPKTGKLTKLSELNVIKMEGIGTGMLEDGVFTTDSWIADKGHQATAKKFLAASFKGWAYCRDNVKDCVNIVLAQGPTLLKMHQTWQMNEINALIWPAPKGVGVMDPKAFARTAKISKQFGVIKKAPSGAYRTDLARAAVASLKGQKVDVNGRKWKKIKVAVTAGGK